MIGFVFFAVVIGQSATEKLTLNDALNIAMKNAFTLRIAESKAEKARRQERAAHGAFGPTAA
jgi:outer membrane protein TolC